jgi:putative resolvase
MKLSAWARERGISYKTAYRLYRKGQFPAPTEQLPTGTIIVFPEKQPSTTNTALYARVSSSDQRNDLSQQLQRLRDYAAIHGYRIIKEIKEIGSGLNGHRSKLIRILLNPKIDIILAEHKDRITRFGFQFIQASLEASNRRIVVLNEEECKDDLVQDMIDVLTSFCARLYGRRSAKNRARNAVEATRNVDSP